MLHSSRLCLRPLVLSDLNSTYLGWLNDHLVNKYLETRFVPQTYESLHSYWEQHRDNSSSPWFAICLANHGTHIGNIKLGPVHWVHRRADVSLFIGDRLCWGKGYATEAIQTIRDWAFTQLDLQKLNAGIYSDNVGSLRCFEKSGFELEGILRQEVVSDGTRKDVHRLGLTRSHWNS